tara:strand:- start:1590 stop:1775 length:186 start_codon:yes stop_codon:yes gene_type:complete
MKSIHSPQPNVKSIHHEKSNEWFFVMVEDPDVDWDTGKYVGISDMLKLSDGNWYQKVNVFT